MFRLLSQCTSNYKTKYYLKIRQAISFIYVLFDLHWSKNTSLKSISEISANKRERKSFYKNNNVGMYFTAKGFK